MKLYELLHRNKQGGTLHSSYLLETLNAENALTQIQDFFVQEMGINLPYDFLLVEKEKDAKNISVDQIRSMASFVHLTSSSSTKVVVVNGAESMNPNAANACLKLLEDSALNTYIFLITEHLDVIVSTITSRCLQIKLDPPKIAEFSSDFKLVSEELLLSLFCNTNTESDIEVRLNFVNKFSDKNRDLWVLLTKIIEVLFSNIKKKYLGIEVEMTNLELKLYHALTKNESFETLSIKCNNIEKLLRLTIELDLELKSSSILLIESLTCRK